MNPKTSPGKAYLANPYGAVVDAQGVMFRIVSRNATRVWLMFFDNKESTEPTFEVEFDPILNKSGDIWHVYIEDMKPGQLYLYRMDGPNDPSNGHRYNAEQWLIDPYTLAVTGSDDWSDLADKKKLFRNHSERPDFYHKLYFAGLPKSVVVDDEFDWNGDVKPRIKPHRSIIYEAHVRGMTIHPDSPYGFKGTFKGLVETIPYLRELGITAIELLPVHEFNELELDKINPHTGESLMNYWGYSTFGFFAPNGQYSSSGVLGEQVREFKEMVKQFHKAGIEVILDVVFNHTAEGNEDGPVYSFKGIDNESFYMLNEPDKSTYMNFSGCGNTVNCNHPVVRDFIIDSLRYWANMMRVDGFRFDLASIMSRDSKGNLMPNPPLIERIAEDPLLNGTKMIAEAWDAGGAYQVGSFYGERWAEWNGRFRDDVRSFIRGDESSRAAFAYRLTGSSDIYQNSNKTPLNSINFITSHDGYTLHDLVSYEEKHNHANGEHNRDGDNNNVSRNYGEEGETDRNDIMSLRRRQVKNFLTVLFVSQGVPMMTAGDEFCRTQKGNNNAYCHDSEISWINWKLKETHSTVFNFCKHIIAFRKRHPVLRRGQFFTGKAINLDQIADITWFDFDGKTPDWEKPSGSLAFLIHGQSSKVPDDDFFIMINMCDEAVKFKVPKPPTKGGWHVAINTARTEGEDIYAPGSEPSLKGDKSFWTVAHSIVVLISQNN